jgi:predicted CopG family antitoxin
MEQADTEISQVFDEAWESLEKVKNEVSSFTQVLQNALGDKVAPICEKYRGQFEYEIKITQGAIETVKQGHETGYTWAKRQKDLNELREKLFKDLKPILPPQEGTMLLEIVRILGETETPWMNVQELVLQLKERLEQGEEEIEPTLKKLVKMNLVKEGASLPI